MGFFFIHGDDRWEMELLTGEEIVDLETKLVCRYIDLQPGVNAKHTLAILATFLLRKRSEEQVEKIIKKMTLRDIVACWDFVPESSLPTEFEDGIPDPKARSTSGTGMSSSSRGRRSVGRQTSPAASRSET